MARCSVDPRRLPPDVLDRIVGPLNAEGACWDLEISRAFLNPECFDALLDEMRGRRLADGDYVSHVAEVSGSDWIYSIIDLGRVGYAEATRRVQERWGSP